MQDFILNSGFINVLKPSGPTSSDIVVNIKRLLGNKKVGHLGTLDPLAAGVLPVAVGKATRLFDYLTYKKKKYRAKFTFGILTDTADAAGNIIETSNNIPKLNDVQDAVNHFKGNIIQIPPKYSAIKIGGRKAYDMARQGVEFNLSGREISIYNLEITDNNKNEFTFDIECSGGTYIRSLCTDIAKYLNTAAYMSMLIRLSSGCFDIKDCITLEDIESEKNRQNLLIPMEFVLKDLKRFNIDDIFYKDLSNGVPVFTDNADEINLLIYCKNEFFGIGNINNNNIYIKTNLR